MFVCDQHVHKDNGDQKRNFGPWELELEMMMNHYMVSGHQT